MRLPKIIQKTSCPTPNLNFESIVNTVCPTTTTTTTCALPGIPQLPYVQISEERGGRLLTWQPVPNIIRYEVWRDLAGGGGEYVKVADIFIDQLTEYLDTYLTEFNPCYKIRSWNACGYSEFSDVTCLGDPPPTTTTSTISTSTTTTLATTTTTTCALPAAPSSVSIAFDVDNAGFRLEWTPAVGATSQLIWRRLGAAKSYQLIATLDGEVADFLDSYNGKETPCYALSSRNSCGVSPLAGPFCLAPPTTTSTSTSSTTSTTSTTTTLATTTTTTQCNCAVPSDSDSVPVMTSNLTPSGLSFASVGSETAYRAFDDDESTGWVGPDNGGDIFIGYIFTVSKRVVRYSFTHLGGTGIPYSWVFEGSNNGADWVALDTQIEQDPIAAYYEVANCFDFTRYRLRITSWYDGSSIGIKEFSMFDCLSVPTTTTSTSTTLATTTTTTPVWPTTTGTTPTTSSTTTPATTSTTTPDPRECDENEEVPEGWMCKCFWLNQINDYQCYICPPNHCATYNGSNVECRPFCEEGEDPEEDGCCNFDTV